MITLQEKLDKNTSFTELQKETIRSEIREWIEQSIECTCEDDSPTDMCDYCYLLSIINAPTNKEPIPKTRNIYEAKGGFATKNDVVNSIGCTLSALAKDHRGENTIPVYNFHVMVKEVKLTTCTQTGKEEKQ